MKTIKQYQCGICNTLWRSETECKNCEEAHIKIVSIIQQDFNSYKSGGEYPKRIECKMSDGSKRIFNFK